MSPLLGRCCLWTGDLLCVYRITNPCPTQLCFIRMAHYRRREGWGWRTLCIMFLNKHLLYRDRILHHFFILQGEKCKSVEEREFSTDVWMLLCEEMNFCFGSLKWANPLLSSFNSFSPPPLWAEDRKEWGKSVQLLSDHFHTNASKSS